MSDGGKILAVLNKMAEDVGYHVAKGAACPVCGERMKTTRTGKWKNAGGHRERVRVHVCKNPRCLLCAASHAVRSVEKKSA